MTDVRTTQVAVEEWVATNPPVQVTQVAIEEWASVAVAVAPTRPPQFAVTVNSG